MKTFEQVSEKAVQIADNDPNASVAVFDLRVRQKIFDGGCSFNKGVFKSHTLTYTSHNGGTVCFFDAGREIWPNCAGYQFTHVFCSDHVSRDDEMYLKSRIRSARTVSPEPMGFYDYNGVVQRFEVW